MWRVGLLGFMMFLNASKEISIARDFLGSGGGGGGGWGEKDYFLDLL